MMRRVTVSRLGGYRGLIPVFVLVASAAACSLLLAGDEKHEAEGPSGRLSPEPHLSALIFVDSSIDIPWTRHRVVTFNPNSGSWRIEDVPRGPAECLRIPPRGATAAYIRPGYPPEPPAVFARSLVASSKEVRLLSGMSGIPCSLAWAPDAKRLLVSTYLTTFVDQQLVLREQTWLVNADGSRITQAPVPETHVVLDWSADGKLLLTTVPSRTQPRKAREHFQYALYVMHPDGSGVRRVTPKADNPSFGRISPDHKSIAYRTMKGPPIGQIGGFSAWKIRICVIKCDGTGRREVTRETNIGIPDRNLCWSPDGKYLAVQFCKWYESGGSISYSVSPEWIEIYDLEGRRIRKLTVPKKYRFSGGAIDWR